jgi:hypothetical protein
MTVNENGLVLFCCQAVACVGLGCMHVCGGGDKQKGTIHDVYCLFNDSFPVPNLYSVE